MTKQTINVGTSPNDRRGDSLRAAFQKVNANFTELYTSLGLDVAPLNLGAFEFNGSVLSTTDSTAITIDQATTITSNLTVGGDILPSVAYGGDLGSAAKPWKSLYVSGSTIYLGNATLSVDAYGEISINNNRLVQDNGNYIRLNSNVNDVNVSDPQPGDTLQWGPGYWINVPNSDHKLVGNGAEVVLFTDGPEPYTLFPAISTDDQLQIVGSEISSVSGDLALTSPTDTLIISNGAGVGGGSKLWTFGANGSLTLPGGTDTITNINDGLDLSVLGMDEETVLTVNLSRNGALTVPFAINFNFIGTNAGFIGPQPNEIVIAGVPNTSIRIAPNDGANGTFLFGTDGSLTIPGDIKSNGNINIDINLSDSTLRRWQFGEDGNLTFPDGTTQSTAWTGIPGPYTDDAAAATAGVSVGKPYYRVSGQVFVRLA